MNVAPPATWESKCVREPPGGSSGDGKDTRIASRPGQSQQQVSVVEIGGQVFDQLLNRNDGDHQESYQCSTFLSATVLRPFEVKVIT